MDVPSPRTLRLTALTVTLALVTGACTSAAAPATSAPASAAAASSASGAAASAAGSAPAVTFHLNTPGVLYVSLTDGDLPEIAVGPNNTLIGTDGYWITQFANKYHLKLKLFPTTLPSEILAVNQGKVDLGTTAFYTQARAKQVYYTYPFFQRTTGVWTKNSFNYTGPSSVMGKQIGEETGYVWVPYERTTFGAANVHVYTTIADTDKALLNGQVDAIIDGCSTGLPGFGPGSGVTCHPLSPGAFGWPDSIIQERAYNYVKCDNSALADALNQELKDLQANGSWQTVTNKYNIGNKLFIPTLTTPPQLCAGS